jgi:hypothetical protein
MHRSQLRWVIPLVLAALGLCVIAPSAANAAPNLLNGCKSTTTSGAGMSHYPAWPGSQSYLRVACIFNHTHTLGGGDTVSDIFTIHDFANAVYHNGSVRTVTASSVPPPAPGQFSVDDCMDIGSWVNRVITGPGMAPYTFVTSITGGCAPGGVVNLSNSSVAVATDSYTIENAATRAVTDATLATVSPMVTSATANFTATDVGLSFTGTDIPDGTTISALISTTQVDLSTAPTQADMNQTVTIGGTIESSNARTFDDATAPAANQIRSLTAGFQASDVGLKVVGPGINQPCYIDSRVSGSVVNLNPTCALALNASAFTVTVGDPTPTAPTSTDTVINQGFQLPLVPGGGLNPPPCSADEPTGYGNEGTWLNPGSFVSGPFAAMAPNTTAVGEIYFKGVVSYAAYVVPMKAGTDPLIAAAHFNVVFPNEPVRFATCPATDTSPGVGFSIGVNATTASQAAIPAGFGRPGTAQVRSLRASTTGATSTVYMTDDVNGPGVNWTGSEFNRVCIIPAGAPAINFACGGG